MPHVKFSYPVDGHKVGEPVHLPEGKANAYVRDGVAVKVAPPKVQAPAKQEAPKPEVKPTEAKPAPKPSAKKPSE